MRSRLSAKLARRRLVIGILLSPLALLGRASIGRASIGHASVGDKQECLDSPASLGVPLFVSAPEATRGFEPFVVPPLPLQPGAYAYALHRAFVVLPRTCVAELNLEPNVGDMDGIVEQWMGRMDDLPGAASSTGHVAEIFAHCACGWALFAHGSGGFTFDNPRYTFAMAAAGYGVVAPDSFASKELGLRYREPIGDLPAHLRRLNGACSTASYWCDNNVYEQESTCVPAMSSKANSTYPLCYSSSADAILSNTTAWRHFYERVFQLRKLELDYLVDNMPRWMKRAPKLFLAGESEGGMVAARYHHPKLERLLETGGRIVLQWGCEWCYFVSCPENAQIGGGRASLRTPVLSAISYADSFFGPPASLSVADRVSRAPGGYGSRNLTGNCLAQLKAQGFEHAYVVNDVGTEYHGLTETTGNLVRTLLWSFLAHPRSLPVLDALGDGPDGARVCSNRHQEGGVTYAECGELGDEEPVPGTRMPQCAWSSYIYHLQYQVLGVAEECAGSRAPPTLSAAPTMAAARTPTSAGTRRSWASPGDDKHFML